MCYKLRLRCTIKHFHILSQYWHQVIYRLRIIYCFQEWLCVISCETGKGNVGRSAWSICELHQYRLTLYNDCRRAGCTPSHTGYESCASVSVWIITLVKFRKRRFFCHWGQSSSLFLSEKSEFFCQSISYMLDQQITR